MDVASAIQSAIITTLRADAGVTALIGARVYDGVPKAPTFPYVSTFDVQLIEDGADEIEADEAFVDIHIWSRKPGSLETKAIAGAIRKALHQQDIALDDDNALVDIRFRNLQVLRDDDGVTTHGVQTFHLLTETTSD